MDGRAVEGVIFYIAAHVSQKTRVKRIYQLLKHQGHVISVEWALRQTVAMKGRNQKPERSRDTAIRDMEGIRDCDVFVLLSEPSDGRAKYVELGGAIATYLDKGKPRIFIVGRRTNQSVFYFHPSVKRVENITAVLAAIKT